MPFRKTRDRAAGTVTDAPIYLFRVIHLGNPMANGPVRFGDPVWFQVRVAARHVMACLPFPLLTLPTLPLHCCVSTAGGARSRRRRLAHWQRARSLHAPRSQPGCGCR